MINYFLTLFCLAASRSVQYSFHIQDQVYVQNISSIASIGDSITASFAARNSQISEIESRGTAFSTGGDNSTLSIASLLSKYSLNVIGKSYQDHAPVFCFGIYCFPSKYETDGYNRAQSGAMFKNMMNQVEDLANIMEGQVEVGFTLLTILIGANDQCYACLSTIDEEDFRNQFILLLDFIKSKLNKVIVLFSSLFKVSEIYRLNGNDPACISKRRYGFTLECPCAFSNNQDRFEMDKFASLFNKISQQTISKYKQTESFRIIYDPTLQYLDLMEWDSGFISDFDCFHPTENAHQILAVMFWNNLFRRRIDKKRAVEVEEIYEPKEGEFIRFD